MGHQDETKAQKTFAFTAALGTSRRHSALIHPSLHLQPDMVSTLVTRFLQRIPFHSIPPSSPTSPSPPISTNPSFNIYPDTVFSTSLRFHSRSLLCFVSFQSIALHNCFALLLTVPSSFVLFARALVCKALAVFAAPRLLGRRCFLFCLFRFLFCLLM